MSLNLSVSSHELLMLVDALSKDKGIMRDDVFEAIEHALMDAAKIKYGEEHDIVVEIDRRSSDLNVYRKLTVVQGVPASVYEISYVDAVHIDPQTKVGDLIKEELPSVVFDRIAAHVARDRILQHIREKEVLKQFNEFKAREGLIVSGTVKRIENNNLLVDLGRTEGLLRGNQLIGRETFRVGDRVKAVLLSVNLNRSTQLFLELSRKSTKFVEGLWHYEVPEIADGIIEIKNIVRDPGSKTKMLVYSKDPNLDPVGTCIGVRGNRVKSIMRELNNEKIDVISYTTNLAVLVGNALKTPIIRVEVDDYAKTLEVVVPEGQVSICIGRSGQNVDLAAKLIGWKIKIVDEKVYKRQKVMHTQEVVMLFMNHLHITEEQALEFYNLDFMGMEEIAQATVEELAANKLIEPSNFDEIISKAKAYLESEDRYTMEKFKAMGGQEDLKQLDGFTPKMLLALVENDVFTIADIGKLDINELMDILDEFRVSREDGEDLIMAIRNLNKEA